MLKISFLCLHNLAAAKTDAEVLQHSKKLWKAQFEPWRQSGFTAEMMEGAKKVYWGKEIDQSKVVMVLWTILDGEIYREVKT